MVKFVKDHTVMEWICQYIWYHVDSPQWMVGADYYRQLWQWSSLKWTPVGCGVTIMTSVENHKKYVGCQSLKFIITTSIIYCCYSPNEHKYISDVMILSERKHFSIRSSHTMSRVDQFIIATNGNIQMKNISCLSHFPIKWCLCLPNIFWKLSSPNPWSNNWWIMHETRGQQWAVVGSGQKWTIEPSFSVRIRSQGLLST